MATQHPPPAPTKPKLYQQPEMTQECRDVISSLPIEEDWVDGNINQYQGCWIATTFMPGVLAFQKHFQAHDTDILLATIPKAGTTWVKAISFALLNRVPCPGTDQQNLLLTKNPHDLVPFLEMELYNQKEVPDLTSFTSPRLFATHLPHLLLPMSVKDSTCKIVYVCRNPKDTFVSLWHFANKMRQTTTSKGTLSLEHAFDMFCRGVSPHGSYWDHVLGYWKESLEKPKKVLFLKFEDMKEHPITNLKRLAEFLGCPFSPEEEAKGLVNDISRLCSFDNLSNLEVNKNGKWLSGLENNAYFRRSETRNWMNYLTAEMTEKLDRVTEEKFHGTGLIV